MADDQNPIYDFLKQNNLTNKDEKYFLQEYSDPNKAKQLHDFFVQNNLTTKDNDSFYNTYFKPQDTRPQVAGMHYSTDNTPTNQPKQSTGWDIKKQLGTPKKGIGVQGNTTDNTAVSNPAAQSTQPKDSDEIVPAIKQATVQLQNDAANNTAKRLGKTPAEILKQASNGDLTLVIGKDGQPNYTRSAGFLESLGNSLKTTADDLKDAAQIHMMGNNPSGFADYMDDKNNSQPNIPTSVSNGIPGAAGSLIGGLVKPVLTFALGNAAAPVIGGFGAVFGESQFTGSAKKQQELYNQGLNELISKGVPADQARIQAAQAAISNAPLAAAPESLMNASLMLGNSPQVLSQSQTFKNYLSHAIKSSGEMFAKGTGTEAATQGIEAAQGYDIDPKEALLKSLDNGTQFGLMDLAFKSAHGILNAPSFVSAAAKDYIANTIPENILNKYASAIDEQIPGEGTKLLQGINSYKEAAKKLDGLVPDEYKPSFAGLTEQQDNINKDIQELEAKKLTAPKFFHEGIDEKIAEKQAKIEANNQKMAEMLKLPNPIELETDPLNLTDNATTNSDKQQQENNQQSSIEQHQGTEAERNETPQSETDNSNSGISSEEAKIVPHETNNSNVDGNIQLDENGKPSFEDFKNHIVNDFTKRQDAFDTKLDVPGLDQRGLEQAARNINEGKDTKSAKTLLDAIKDMHERGEVDVKRGIGGTSESVSIPFEFYFKNSPEEVNESINFAHSITPEQSQRLADIVEKEGITPQNIDEFKNLFHEFDSPYTPKDFEDIKQSFAKLPEDNKSVQEPGGNTKTPSDQTATNEQPVSDTGNGNSTASDGGSGEGSEADVKDDDGNVYTSLKRMIYDAERDAEGKLILDTSSGKSATERAAETAAKIKSGEISQQEIRDIATALANGEDINTKLSPEEIEHVLAYDKVTLGKEGRQIESDLNESIKLGDKEAEANNIFKLAQNEILKEENYRAARNLHAEWGRQGQAMQLSIDNDYSFEHLKDRITSATGDPSVPEDVKAKLREMSGKIGELQDKIDEHQKKLDAFEVENKKKEEELQRLHEENSKLKAGEKVESEKNKKKIYTDKKEALEKRKAATIEEIRKKYNKLRGTANSGINFNLLELSPLIGKLARIHIENGVVELEELMGKMLTELREFIPDLTERELRDTYSGYGKKQKLSTDPIDITESQLKSKAKAVSGLEDVKYSDIAPLRSGAGRHPLTEETKGIIKEIQSEMRAKGIDINKSKDPEQVWKTALEAYKTRIKNRLDYLTNVKGINDIERFKKEQTRVKTKLDQEAKDLKSEQQKQKNRVDDLVKQYEFNKWNNYQKAVHYANRFSKGILVSNPATLAKILGSVAWRSVYKPLHAITMYGASKIMPETAKVQGINTLSDLASHLGKYYSTMFSKEMMNGIRDTFKNHNTQEDLLYGKHYSRDNIPQVKVKDLKSALQASFFNTLRLLERNQSLHGAEKNIAAKPEYEAWKDTIQKNLIREGSNPAEFSDKTTEEIINQLAFQKSLRARFMQDNTVASIQKTAESYLRNKGKIGTAELLNALLPITKIGSNYVGESMEKLPITGIIPQIFHSAFRNGKMTEVEKGNILRALSYQGVGMASYLLGMYMYKNINPFYQSSSKKYADKNGKELPEDKNDLGAIPEVWAHSPDAMLIRAGASHAWVWDKYDDEHKTGGKLSSFMKSLTGAIYDNNRAMLSGSPYISTAESTLSPVLNNGDVGKAAANMIKGRIPFSSTLNEISQHKIPVLNKLSPKASEWLGEQLGIKPEETKPSDLHLSPKGFEQNMGIGVPGWREKVLQEMFNDKYGPKEQKSNDEKRQDIEDRRQNRDKLEQDKQKFSEENGIDYIPKRKRNRG